MLRTPTVFEAVVKTVCTTNVAWSATGRMVTALVESLGEQTVGGAARAFPTAEAMAAEPDMFYREVVRVRVSQRLPPSARVGRRGENHRAGRPRRCERRSGRRSRNTIARSSGDRPVRRGALDDVARATLAADPRLVDTAEVRTRQRP